MPIDNINFSEKQGRLFQDKLAKELNPTHKLYKLRELINWGDLENQVANLVNVERFGRSRKSTRILLALAMLQAMDNYSDCATSEMFEENMYWQYFCGYEYGGKHVARISESTIRRFRSMLGEEGYNLILKELTRIGLKAGAYKKKDLDSVIIDTTVQIKNVKHPHDAYLMEKARQEIVDLCKELNIPLNETYAKSFKYRTIKLWKYKKDSKVKQRWKLMKSLKTRLGRLIRIFERAVETSNLELSKHNSAILLKVKNIHAQSVLKKKDKDNYKKDNAILYSFHANEVECIGKGKLNKPYEFGNKVAIAVSGRGNFVLGVKSFHGNPYDGHTLAETIEQLEQITENEVKKVFVDLGYRGSNYKHKGKIYTPYTKKDLSKSDKLMQKRRSAIEPVIGHLKQYGRMGRNYLKGVIGDIINPLISAIGFNLRNIANTITKTPKLVT